MNLLRRFVPLLTSLLQAGILAFLLLQPDWFLGLFSFTRVNGIIVAVLVALSLLSLLAALLLIGQGYRLSSRLRFYPFLFITTASALTVFLYSDYRALLIAITLLVPMYTWIWLESLYLFWQQPVSYQPYSLQRLAAYLYLLEMFLFVAAAAGAEVLFQIPSVIVVPVAAMIYGLVQYDLLMMFRLKQPYAARVAAVGAILAFQLHIVLNALPTHFLMYAGLMVLFFYTWIGLARLATQPQGVHRKQILPYALVSSIGSFVIFVSYMLMF
ncbi:MAG: hypothetical protein HY461_00985 [Parcubacteria group bacterium]|nr:hypothetical protein [Parcubacteria group bacterium]